MSTQELIYKVRFDPAAATAAMDNYTRAVAADLQQITNVTRQQAAAQLRITQQTEGAKLRDFQRSINEIARVEQRRVAETIRSANQRLREEQRAAREVARINAETARQAAAQDRIRERAAKQLADVQIREARRAARELERTLAEQRRFDAAQVTRSSGASSLFAGAIGGATAIIGLSAANEIRQAAAAWLDYSSKLETTRIAFTTMLGSAEAADVHLKELQRFALTTPFQFIELIDASQRMQALGFRAEQVVPILTDVGNAVAAAGGGSERLDRVVLALSQMQSKGKVATQELNQLAEAGISGFKILEQALGKSRAELVEMVEQGQVSSKVFLDAFQKFSQANFGGLMEKQSRTFAGAMSNIKDALLATAGTAFEPLFKKISEITDQIAQELQKGQSTLESVTRSITSGLVEIITTAGAQAGAGFIESTARKIGDPSAWKQLLSNISGVTLLRPALRGLFSIDPEDLFGLGDVEIPQIKLPDLTVPLKAQANAQTEVSESAKKAGEIVKDLTIRLNFYGDTTERAATLQKLLAIGTDAVASAEGRRAIQLATLIDRQRLANEASEAQRKLTADLAAITEAKYKTAFEGLTRTIQDSTLSILELNAAELGGLSALERFNLGLGAQVKGMLDLGQASGLTADQMLGLFKGLLGAQKALRDLGEAQALEKQRVKLQQLKDSLSDFEFRQNQALRQIRFGDKTAVQEADEFVQLIRYAGLEVGTLTKFWLNFNAHLIDSNKRMREMLDLMRATADAVPKPGGRVAENLPRIVFDDSVLGAPPPPPDFNPWIDAIRLVKEELADFGRFASEAIVGGLNGVAGALAQGVEAWALYGVSIGKAMKQALAASLARIAGEATFQGALHAAWALGSLAFGDFAGAGKHAIAAAKFFAVAAATGLGARAIAGSTFQQGGGGSAGGEQRSGPPQPLQTIVQDRNRPPQGQVITVRLQSDLGQLDKVITASVVRNIGEGGEIREVIANDRRGG